MIQLTIIDYEKTEKIRIYHKDGLKGQQDMQDDHFKLLIMDRLKQNLKPYETIHISKIEWTVEYFEFTLKTIRTIDANRIINVP